VLVAFYGAACGSRPTAHSGEGGRAGTAGGSGGGSPVTDAAAGDAADLAASGGSGGADAAIDHPAGAGGTTSAGGTTGAAGTIGAGGRTGVGGRTGPTDDWQILEQPISHKVDILFMIDNSQSMLPLQNKLLASFPVFMNVLKGLPMGLPDLHLAVISSDTGPGRFDLPDRHCAFFGDGGRFQSQARGICAGPPLPAGQFFLAAANNQQTKNYTGDIVDAFTCIAALGDLGCGFEGQLKSVRWALDPINVPYTNVGFLRPDAYLSVILITNEDDCSLPDDSDLIDPQQTRMSDPYGPLWSFRCNEFGHLCNIDGTLQSVPRGPAMSNLQGCVSNETQSSKLTHLGDEIQFLKSLKSDPRQLLVSVVAGPAAPYSIEMIQNAMDVEVHPNMLHSCTQNSGEYADPAVRLQQWTQAFGRNGLFLSICANSFAPALQLIANKIAGVFGPFCVDGPFPPASGAAHPPCRVADRFIGSNGQRVEIALANCGDNGNLPPCWSLAADPDGCLDGQRLLINRGAATPPPDLTTAFTCAPCRAGVPEPGCP
jgi:hypothetical protein